MATERFDFCFQCGAPVKIVTARRGDLVLYFDRNKSSKHECKEEDLPYRCPGPAFCDEINCDYCSHL